MNTETIGGRVRRLRLSKGIRFQKDLATMIGIDPASLNQIEQGYRVPKLATVDKLAIALGTTRDVILDGEQTAARAAPPQAVASPPEAASMNSASRRSTDGVTDSQTTLDRASLSALIRTAVQEEMRGALVDLGFAIAQSAQARRTPIAERKGKRSGAHGQRTGHA